MHQATDPLHTVTVPFGGMKASGMGREFGLDGLKAWVELQAKWVMK